MIKKELGSFNYGSFKSSLYYYPENKSTIEILEINPKIFLLQGSKEYIIKDIYKVDEFQERFGLEGEAYHSRLASIGKFSDYLKEAVPTFELYMLYINSLSSGIVKIGDSLLVKRIEDLKKTLKFKEEKLNKLRFDQESGLSVGREIISIETEIREIKNKLDKDIDEKRITDRIAKEYQKKGVGATFIVRIKSTARFTNKVSIDEDVASVLDDLRYKNKIIKAQAWHGFKIIIEDLENTALALSAESIGLFDPRSLEETIEQYNYKELEDLKKNIESLFLYRPAADIKVGENHIQKSSAVAQGIASLMRRAISKPPSDNKFPKPEYNKLPSIKDKDKKLAYMGFILEDGIKMGDFPFLFDLNCQGPQHTMIVGATGSGKTICASNLAEGSLIQNIPVFVIDTTKQWTGFLQPCQTDQLLRCYKKFEMKDFKPTGFQGRIFTPNSDVGINLETNLLAKPDTKKKDELQQCAHEIAAIIKVICKLNSNETMYLRTVILEEWEQGQILDYIKLRKSLNNWARIHKKNVFETTLKLEELEGYPFLFKGEKLKINELWKAGEISVINLNHLADNQKIYTSYFLLRELLSYFYSQPDSSELKFMLFIEEAHKFIPKETPGVPNELYLFLDRVVRELRRKGVGTVFISQIITDFRHSIRANTATKIRMRIKYDRDIIRSGKDIGTIFANFLPRLNTGQGIVNFSDYGTPFFVQFRPPLHNPEGLSDEEIHEEMILFKEKNHVSELLEMKVDEINRLSNKELKDDLEVLSIEKLQALEEFFPEAYDVIKKLKNIVENKIDIIHSDEEVFLQQVRSFQDKIGTPPKQSDILSELGWGWKKISEIVNTLEEQGRLKMREDLNDKRVKRIILNE